MTTIPFIDTKGRPSNYKQSFDSTKTERLGEFLVAERDNIATMIEIATDADKKMATSVRHDVDHSLDHALAFARWEYSLGIRASYFVLHTAYYFRDFEDTMAKCREIRQLGHEVGIHMDACTAAKILGGTGEPGAMAHYILKTTLLRMAGAGVVVRGSACHGSALNCDNLSFWDTYRLREFRLEYEAYHLHRDLHANYISDNRGQLRAPLRHVLDRPTHLLIHPEHWQLPTRGDR